MKLFDEMIIEITGELCHLAPMEAARLEKLSLIHISEPTRR